MSIPRKLIHTFVENTIKHGIRQREEPVGGEMRISAKVIKKEHTEIND